MAGAIERAKAAAIKVRFFMRSPSNERSGFPVANRFGLQAEIETDYRKIVQSVKLSTSDEQGDMGAVGLSLNLRSEEHTSELQSLMRISYAVFCLKKKKKK